VSDFAPFLLDRLADTNLTSKEESAAAGRLTQVRMQSALQRDIAALLAAIPFETFCPLEWRENVRLSVLNFGIGDFSGASAQGFNFRRIEAEIRSAILHFETRISPSSLTVQILAGSVGDARSILNLMISGEAIFENWRWPVKLSAMIDLETGVVRGGDSDG
jgi:type VI secretion system protein ImpF